jgi:hypothetical protein
MIQILSIVFGFITFLAFTCYALGIPETFGLGRRIRTLELRGPFNRKTIPVPELLEREWNDRLLSICYIHYRVLRASQLFIIITVLVQSALLYFSLQDENLDSISASDLFATSQSTGSIPLVFILFLGSFSVWLPLSLWILCYRGFLAKRIGSISDQLNLVV